MTEILWTGSECSRWWPTRAWPISWKAVMRRSFSLMTRVFFSGPAMTRMIPSSSSCWPISRLPVRAASSAASLTRFARSAPVKPGVCPARSSMLIAFASGLPRVWTSRIFARPLRSGRSTTIWRSKRPGRSSAGSRMSGRVVAAMAADGVDLVHEDDAGAVLLGLLEQVAHARGADADEHLDEVRAGDREERHARLAGDGAREQRLAGARRPVEQHALRDAGAERLELLRVLQELLDLVELLGGLVHAGHVAERDLRRVDRHALGARLAERHDLRAAALHLVHQEDPEPDEDDERQDVREQAHDHVGPRRLHVEALELVLRLRRAQLVDQHL